MDPLKHEETPETNSNDVLSQVLRLLSFRANVYFHSSYCNGWSVDASGTGMATFHVVADGNCWLHLSFLDQPVKLNTGDMVIFPRDAPHLINERETLSGEDVEATHATVGKKPVALVCGYFEFDSPRPNPVIHALPEWLLVRADDDTRCWLEGILTLMQKEVGVGGDPGSDVVTDRLSEILFIYAIRHYVFTQKLSNGLFAALGDTRMTNILNALHRSPAEKWSLERMARIANMSRTGVTKLFTDTLEMAPMQYVAYWRMQLAYKKLQSGRESMLEIADSVGYKSESAFRKAFKQIMGITPGSVRRTSTEE